MNDIGILGADFEQVPSPLESLHQLEAVNLGPGIDQGGVDTDIWSHLVFQGTPSSGLGEPVSLLHTPCELKWKYYSVITITRPDFLNCFIPRIIFMISAQCWLNKEIKTNINPKIVIPVVNTNRIIISVVSKEYSLESLKKAKMYSNSSLSLWTEIKFYFEVYRLLSE